MIYLLYGSDTRRSREKLNETIVEYRQKIGGGSSFYTFDAEEEDAAEIKRVLAADSLFSNKKIVVLKYLSLSPSKEILLDELKKIKNSQDVVIFLWERELSEKVVVGLRPYCSKMQEFSTQGGSALGGKDISIFDLGDTFFTSPREGLRALLGLLHAGHDDFNLFSYLINHARTLAVAKYYMDRREPIPAKHGLHPYVVKKAENAARSLSGAALPRALRNFFEEDKLIKTGLAKPKDSLLRMYLN